MTYYYVGSVISPFGSQKQMQIMEESEGGQVCIALVPFNQHTRNGWTLARKDALMIVEALNWQESRKSLNVYDK